MTDKVKQVRKNRIILIVLVLVFFLPVVSAWYMVFFTDSYRNGESTVHGHLIKPPRLLPDISLAGSSVESKQMLYGKWTLVAVAGDQCEKACLDNLYRMRQIRLAMGKELDRVQRVLLYNNTDANDQDDIAGQYPGQLFASIPDIGPAFKTAFFKNQDSQDQGLFLVDPRGYLMLYFPDDANPSGIIKDLSRLLRLSKAS